MVYKTMVAVDKFGSSAICECSFSAEERVGVPKRISMTDDSLRHPTFLAFEEKIRAANVSVDEVLNRFNDIPNRKLQLYHQLYLV